MTGHIIQLPGDPHRDVLALLPWHVTGQLDAADTVRVEAHLHGCTTCRAALATEQRLDRAIVRAPAGVDAGWADMRKRLDLDHLDAAPPRRTVHATAGGPADWRPSSLGRWLGWPPGWRLGTPAALAALVALFLLPLQVPARFAALGTATPGVAGNMLVIFRPDTTEAALRQALRAAGARLVDGPTAANAYVIAVPKPTRAAALERLRHQPQVVLAEPIDASRQP